MLTASEDDDVELHDAAQTRIRAGDGPGGPGGGVVGGPPRVPGAGQPTHRGRRSCVPGGGSDRATPPKLFECRAGADLIRCLDFYPGTH